MCKFISVCLCIFSLSACGLPQLRLPTEILASEVAVPEAPHLNSVAGQLLQVNGSALPSYSLINPKIYELGGVLETEQESVLASIRPADSRPEQNDESGLTFALFGGDSVSNIHQS